MNIDKFYQYAPLYIKYSTGYRLNRFAVTVALSNIEPTDNYNSAIMQVIMTLEYMIKYQQQLYSNIPPYLSMTDLLPPSKLQQEMGPIDSILRSIWQEGKTSADIASIAFGATIRPELDWLVKCAHLDAFRTIRDALPMRNNKFYNHGICSGLSMVLSEKFPDHSIEVIHNNFSIRSLFVKWPGFSGRDDFPVPGSWWNRKSPFDMYCSTIHMWKGVYGCRRKSLLYWLIDQLETELGFSSKSTIHVIRVDMKEVQDGIR